MVKNPPANAGDMDSSPGLGRSHMPRSNKATEPQLLSPRATTTEAHVAGAHALQQERPPQWEACLSQLEKAHMQQWRPNAAKKKINKFKKKRKVKGTSLNGKEKTTTRNMKIMKEKYQC